MCVCVYGGGSTSLAVGMPTENMAVNTTIGQRDVHNHGRVVVERARRVRAGRHSTDVGPDARPRVESCVGDVLCGPVQS